MEPHAKIIQGLKAMVLIIKFILSQNLEYSLYLIFLFTQGITWCNLQCTSLYLTLIFLKFFFKEICKFYGVGVLNEEPPLLNIFLLIHMHTLMAKNSVMYDQLDLEVIFFKKIK